MEEPPVNVWEVFGHWVQERQAGLRPKMTDVEMARRVGITAQHLGAIKRGRTGTKRSVVTAIALALGENPDEALELAGFRGLAPEQPDIRLARRLTLILRRLPADKRELAERALERDAENYVSLMCA